MSPLSELIWICPRPDAFPLVTQHRLYLTCTFRLTPKQPKGREAAEALLELTSSPNGWMLAAGVADVSLAIVSAAGVVQGCHNLYRVLLARGPPLPPEVGSVSRGSGFGWRGLL